ncbi:mandelate racemase/muconate lactonizing enzyme family protein [Sphingomonas zeae]|jgi:L-alanine-DL-glutamate epimerase-like enolase superfamily enzyme
MTANAIDGFRITRFAFARDRVIGDSQVRSDATHVAAIELVDGSGRSGLGFCQTLFTPMPDQDEVTRIFASEAWPALEGREPAALALRVNRVRGGNVRRMSLPFEEALQHATWDLFAQQMDLPLWKMLGAERPEVGVYASGLDYHLSDHDFAELFGRAAERGFRGFKIKVGHPDIGRDLHRLNLLRQVTGGARPVMIDSNEAWSAQETIDALKLFKREGHSIYWMEDPIPREDFDGLRMIRQLGLTRVNAGEYLDLTGKRRLLEARACDMLNVHGQVSDVMRAGWLANEANVEVTLGNSFLEIGLNMAAALPGVRWLEYSFQNFDHLVEQPFKIDNGLIRAHDMPGHGLKLSQAARQHHARPSLETGIAAAPASVSVA